jgi:hypothetical protein
VYPVVRTPDETGAFTTETSEPVLNQVFRSVLYQVLAFGRKDSSSKEMKTSSLFTLSGVLGHINATLTALNPGYSTFLLESSTQEETKIENEKKRSDKIFFTINEMI